MEWWPAVPPPHLRTSPERPRLAIRIRRCGGATRCFPSYRACRRCGGCPSRPRRTGCSGSSPANSTTLTGRLHTASAGRHCQWLALEAVRGRLVLVLVAAERETTPRLWSSAWASAAAALTISRGCRRWRTWRNPRRWRCNCRTLSGLDRTEVGAVGVVDGGGSVALRRRLEMGGGVIFMFSGCWW